MSISGVGGRRCEDSVVTSAWRAIGVAAALLSVGACRSDAPVRFCADVGLDGPVASTPEQALESFLQADPNQVDDALHVEDWSSKSSDERRVTFETDLPASTRSIGLPVVYELTVVSSAGSWHVIGGCVT